jgi:hypothetical protein
MSSLAFHETELFWVVWWPSVCRFISSVITAALSSAELLSVPSRPAPKIQRNVEMIGSEQMKFSARQPHLVADYHAGTVIMNILAVWMKPLAQCKSYA